MQPIAEFHGVDAKAFRDTLFTRYRPAVLRGLVADWPAVRHARASAQSVCEYLNAFDSGSGVDTVMIPARFQGRIFYNNDMGGFNFTRDKLTISAVNEQLLRFSKFQNRPGVAVQSALMSECLPGFAAENRLPVLDASVEPRIWLGSAVVTPAHFDESNNIACVVSGRRRFTLFPPEQIANLYIGPIGYAPTGTPISLISFRDPDFNRFPRFKEALAAAEVAELEPGDAVFIPTLWWHHVESLEKHNMLVNYWWKGAPGSGTKTNTALNCLLLALLDLKHLPPEQRQAWRVIFDHYVFDAKAGGVDYIPERVRGVLGDISPELAQQVRAFVAAQLQK